MDAKQPTIAVFVDGEHVTGDARFSPKDVRFDIFPSPSTLAYWQQGKQDFEVRNEYFFVKNAMWLSKNKRKGFAFIDIGVPIGDTVVQVLGFAEDISYGKMVYAERKIQENLLENASQIAGTTKADLDEVFGELIGNPAPVFKGKHNPRFKPIIGAKFSPIEVSVPNMDDAIMGEIEFGDPIYDSRCVVKCPPGASKYPCIKPLAPFCDLVYCNTNKRVEYDHKLAEFLRGALGFLEPVPGKGNDRYVIVDFDVIQAFSGSTKAPPRDSVEFGMSEERNLSRFTAENPLFKFGYRILPSSDEVPDNIKFPEYSAVISVKKNNYRIMLCKKARYGQSVDYVLNLPVPEPASK